MSQVSVLFVCLGNICRSPTAHGVFMHQVAKAGLGDLVTIDSAGTSDWHIGKSPDHRTTACALNRGYDLSILSARQVIPADFKRFDYILAMDNENLAHLQRMRPNTYAGTLGLFLDFAEDSDYREVPDPYYGGAQGFELVLDLIESAGQGLLQRIQAQLL
ncbi:low molecular weight protein-tyrosine-phosphatase [Maricurvus nonylphenolicus]|uniref:low molecular weight protein-tyrosine-phosphatase n=1 Tax=Maricurvus nonylphenolicus TaxID=1008307 RepID=UPI0036F3456C